jgi:oligopeptidase A
MTVANPLLNFENPMDFASVRAEHVSPALDTLLREAELALELAVSPFTPAQVFWLSRVLDVPLERLTRAWGTVGHLQAVADTPEMRAAQNDNLPRVSEFFTRLASDERLYARYKQAAASPAAAELTPAQDRALCHALRDFVLGGAELNGAAREQFTQHQARLAELSQRFGQNVLDATDRFLLDVPASRLAGVPADVVQRARELAQAAGGLAEDTCRLTLKGPCLMPVLAHAEDRALREAMYSAHAQRASEFGPAELDNTALITHITRLREQQAALLGHASAAHVSLVPKMARTPQEVLSFLRDLAARARPQALADIAELRRFAAAEFGIDSLQAWDLAFVEEKLRQHRFALDSKEVKRYFTAPRVMAGLFALIERLFGVEIRPGEAPVWHPSVTVHTLWRQGQLIGSFYLDLYARPGKQQGAWMDSVLQRWKRPDNGTLQAPVAHLVCNFAPPTGQTPSLLSHDDLITTFHEFGHGLHHLLTEVDEAAVAGIAGVEWDAAELPSQFMENFCWDHEVLVGLSGHVDDGRELPRELFDKMLAARNFLSGLHLLRQTEYALFDMRLHAEASAGERFMQLVDQVRGEVAVLQPPNYQRYPHSFTHIFDGGYAAGYYGYQWAEVLSADAFAAFEESGLFDPATARRWQQEVLARGGSRSALENFVAFRGREPQLDAYLRHQGLLAAA